MKQKNSRLLSMFLVVIMILNINFIFPQSDEDSLYVTVIEQVGDPAKTLYYAKVTLDFGTIEGERSHIGIAYTNQDHAVFPNLSPGIYTVTASMSDYISAQKEFTKEVNITGYLSIALERESPNATGSARIALLEKYAPQTKQYILNGHIELLDPVVSDEGIPLVVASSGTESGEVVFSDLPVGFYAVQATAPGHISSETPTIQIKANAETWMPISMDRAECKELEAGHNGDIKYRHNIILIANDYDNIETFKQRMKEIINIEGYNETGLLSEMPFADYKDSFNVFYVDKLFDTSNFVSGSRLCTEIDKNRQVIRFIFSNSYRGGTAALCGGMANVYDDESDLAKDITSHEFGHSFGCLYDEYSFYHSACGETGCQLPQYVNCDIANTSVGCPKWCRDSPVSAEELSARVCSTYTSETDCYAAPSEGKPCDWLKYTSTCMNIVSYCYTFTAQYACGFDSYGFCQWSLMQDPYFQANCIPVALDNIDIGKGCESNTGCYKVCQYINWYSSTVASKMKFANLPFGWVNSNALIERIQSLQEPAAAPETEEKPGLIVYDKFEAYGTISGGIITLDEIVADPELMGVVKESAYYGEEVEKEDINLGNVNVDRIVRTYLGESLEPTTPSDYCPENCTCDEQSNVIGCYGEGFSGKGISISTEEAVEIVEERNIIEEIDQIEIKETMDRITYEITGSKSGRLFFIVRVTANIKTSVDAETGVVISVDKPWWSFLASRI